jgi:hypothetical protein
MRHRFGILTVAVVVLIAGASFGDAGPFGYAQGVRRAQLGSMTFGPIPPYHETVPKGSLGKTLPPSTFPNDPVTERAYAIAAKIKPILYQMPCYCHCDQELGHSSLLNCYQDRHASICGTCKMELYYAYEQHRKGKSTKQIRDGIIRGEWESVDMSKWSAPYPGHTQRAKKPATEKQP